MVLPLQDFLGYTPSAFHDPLVEIRQQLLLLPALALLNHGDLLEQPLLLQHKRLDILPLTFLGLLELLLDAQLPMEVRFGRLLALAVIRELLEKQLKVVGLLEKSVVSVIEDHLL